MSKTLLAMVRAGDDAPVGNLGVVKRGGAFEPSAALQALLDGRALDVPAPADRAIAAFQAGVLDALLRGTVAPMGELGLLCVRDELKIQQDAALGADVVVNAGQRVSLHASPPLRAAAMGADAPPLPDPSRLEVALAAMPGAPVAGAIPETTLEVLGFHGGEARTNYAGVPFAVDDDAGAWTSCAVEGSADPHVMWDVPMETHDCRLYRARLSQWHAAAEIAAALQPFAPSSLPAAALVAIAEKMSELGRPAGELARLLWRTPDWRPARPTAQYQDSAVAMAPRTHVLRFAWGGGTLDVPPLRIFDVYALDDNWLRLWGAFDDAVVKDIGPLPPSSVAALISKLRLALGLPPVLEQRTDLKDLAGRSVRLWVDLTTEWHGPSIDRVTAILPTNLPAPQLGNRVRLRGFFDGPAARLRVLVWRPA